MDDARVVRHSTQATVIEITVPQNPWCPDRFTALCHTNVYLPKGLLYTLMAVHSTTLKSTFIASKSCSLLLLYVTHCAVSKVALLFHKTNRLFSLNQKRPHTFIMHTCSLLRVLYTKFTKRTHSRGGPNI